MKVCFVAPGYYPDWGGAEEYIRALAERLVRKGHEVQVLVPAGVGVEASAEEKRNGVQVHRLRAYGGLFSKRLIRLEGLENWLRKIQPDLVHVQSHASLYSLQAAKACRKLGIPYVVLTYGPTVEHNRGGLLRDALVELVDFMTAKNLLSGAAVVLYRTSNILPWCRRQGAKRLVQAPTGFEDAFLELPPQGRKKACENKKVIGFVGGLSRRKGALELVQALPNVLAKHPTALLVLVGGEAEAGMKTKLEAAAKRLGVGQALWLVGNVDASAPAGLRELVGWFDSFDVFCLPSAWEGPSQALLQALARGKPVITALIPALEGLVDEKCNGLVKFGDVEGLAAAINVELADENRRKLARNANRAAVAGHGFNQLAAKLEKTYAEAVADASRSVDVSV